MVWRGSTLRGSDKETINKEYRSTTKDAVKKGRMDGRRALTTMGSTGNNKKNDDNTFGCPGATGVARPRTEKNKPKNSTKDAQNKLH